MAETAPKASKCFLCDEVAENVVWREKGFEGRLCRCGLLYTNRCGMDVLVDPTIDHHNREFYSAPAELKAAWTARNCPPGRLLEVGCGEGFFLKAARANGYEVCGIEPEPHRAQQARDQLGVPIEQAFLEDSRLPRASFDVVYHCDLLVHFPDPISQLSRMAAFLRPGGVLCFEVGILGGLSPNWYKLIGGIGLGEHLWLYSDRAVKTLFAKSGLVVEKIQYFGLAPEVVWGKVSGIVNNRVFRPLLNLARPLGILPAPEVAQKLHMSALNFLRYRVGYFAPRIGPQTLFVVARPEKYLTPSHTPSFGFQKLVTPSW
jgi:SAM-dependent methyltransferase